MELDRSSKKLLCKIKVKFGGCGDEDKPCLFYTDVFCSTTLSKRIILLFQSNFKFYLFIIYNHANKDLRLFNITINYIKLQYPITKEIKIIISDKEIKQNTL